MCVCVYEGARFTSISYRQVSLNVIIIELANMLCVCVCACVCESVHVYRHSIEFLLGDKVLPYNLTVFQAIKQYGLVSEYSVLSKDASVWEDGKCSSF